jgi:anti-sigma regulatory factor (Ser/Thr protein kinase)
MAFDQAETILSAQGRQTVFHIGEPSEVAAARRAACNLAKSLGFNETVTAEIAIAVTEAGTNIAKYAGTGEILLRKAVRYDGAVGVEILALDQGPGIPQLSQSMKDGNSSGGSYGIGLGTMQRLADQFDIYTAVGQGTVICLTFWSKPDDCFASWLDIGMICLPTAGETMCGDAWGVRRHGEKITVLLADGLGHGPFAASASEAASLMLVDHPDSTAAEMLRHAHLGLQETRGAAVGVACIHGNLAMATFAGVGNIAGRILQDGKSHHLISHNGIVGSNLRKVQEFISPWSSDSLLIMHSDGLKTRWDIDQYPGLAQLYPALIAAVLYRDFNRANDDTTVLVCRSHEVYR